MLSSRTDVLENAFQKNTTEKIKMKWGNSYTLPEGDGGSASLSLLYQCLGDTELQKRLERGCKRSSRKDKRIPQIREPQLHTFREAEVAWAITEWDNLPAWLSLS